ncbi:N-acetylglucosamine-6-phosphate deacetylase [Bacillus kwashiorkori]|uniref:N-acetylglucosamine-6-phosphate deacetylase n=1 Tax=Bacillus kwashiorkori TaxID=1522318 RepID=UPI00078289CA|nr:N-acetylglucosamine-6-phosphate deacetylase [Bacillus kwashiorkori]
MDTTQKKLLITGTIVLENELVENSYVIINGEKIEAVGMNSTIPENFQGEIIQYNEPIYVAPGFIDVHIHGANGADTMDATTEAIDTMAQALVKEGTTSFLATTITQEKSAIERALENVADYVKNHNKRGKAEVVGIHLEGPFINPVRKGAQPEQYIIDPSVDQFKQWQEIAEGNIKLVTLAPEQSGGYELIQYLSENGVIPSIGHTDANYTEVEKAVKVGASHVTHLFNGMKGVHHREPGTAGAALLFNELNVELIVDGFHLRPEMVDLVVRVKGTDKITLVTDAMRAKCLKNGVSELGGQKVIVKDGKAVLEDGTLAGSILKMKDSVKNMTRFAKISLPEAVKLASMNPARELHIDDRKGSLEPGKDADIVVLNKDYEPILTICRGTIAYKGD